MSTATGEARREQAPADLLDSLLDDTGHVPAPLTLADVRDRATLESTKPRR